MREHAFKVMAIFLLLLFVCKLRCVMGVFARRFVS